MVPLRIYSLIVSVFGWTIGCFVLRVQGDLPSQSHQNMFAKDNITKSGDVLDRGHNRFLASSSLHPNPNRTKPTSQLEVSLPLHVHRIAWNGISPSSSSASGNNWSKRSYMSMMNSPQHRGQPMDYPDRGAAANINKREWEKFQGSWGKRGLVTSHQHLKDTDDDELDERRGNYPGIGWSKRDWKDLQQSWGKRNWDKFTNSWGKRNWDKFTNSWGKRNWEKLNNSWGKRNSADKSTTCSQCRRRRNWNSFTAGSWGKRNIDLQNTNVKASHLNNYEGPWRKHELAAVEGIETDKNWNEANSAAADDRMLPMISAHDYNPNLSAVPVKRSRGDVNSPTWNSISRPWVKRDPGWNNLKGLWGKRSDSMRQ